MEEGKVKQESFANLDLGWNRMGKGLHFESRHPRVGKDVCKASGKKTVTIKGMGSFNICLEIFLQKCPLCGVVLEKSKEILFSECSYQVTFVKQDGKVVQYQRRVDALKDFEVFSPYDENGNEEAEVVYQAIQVETVDLNPKETAEREELSISKDSTHTDVDPFCPQAF